MVTRLVNNILFITKWGSIVSISIFCGLYFVKIMLP